MDFSSCKPSSSIMFLNVLFFIVALLAKPSNGDLLSDVCRQTPNQVFCLNVLGPRAKTASLSELELLAIDVTSFRTFEIKETIHSLFVAEKDARLKNIYGLCDNYYSLALKRLTAAKAAAQSGLQRDVKVLANGVSIDAMNCEKPFSASPPRKSTLSTHNQVVKLLGNIIAVIANMSK